MFLRDGGKDRCIHEGGFDRLEVKAWTKDPQRGSLLVCTMEDSFVEPALEFCNGRFRDVASDLFDVLLP